MIEKDSNSKNNSGKIIKEGVPMAIMARPQKQPFVVAHNKSADFKKKKISKEHWDEIMKNSKMFEENNLNK